MNAPRTWPNNSLSAKRGAERRDVDRDERAVGARAVAMNCPGGQFLAGAAFAGQQHGGVRAAASAICLYTSCMAGERPTMPSTRIGGVDGSLCWLARQCTREQRL